MILLGIMLGYLSFYISSASLLAGFVVAHLGGGKREGHPGRVKSIIVSWRRYRFHMHHWVVAFIISLACALKGVYLTTPEIFYGFLGGLVFQGIYYYDDWHRIITRRGHIEPS
jgi:hypothetical protein